VISHTLPCGSVLLIDDEDAGLLSFPWRSQGNRGVRGGPYAYTNKRNIVPGTPGTICIHRLILGDARGLVIDHIDGNGLNNTRANLRHCTRAQNSQNAKVRSHSKSGLKGVMLESCGKGHPRRWRSTVIASGVRHRKYFDNAAEADAWAKAKREELHGAFSRHA
jgi:hypothetical protein